MGKKSDTRVAKETDLLDEQVRLINQGRQLASLCRGYLAEVRLTMAAEVGLTAAEAEGKLFEAERQVTAGFATAIDGVITYNRNR